MYTTQNFKSKKALRDAVAAWNAHMSPKERFVSHVLGERPNPPPPVTYFQPGPFAGNEPRDGVIYCEGPHYPEPHRWYAACEVRDGVIVKVKG